MPLSDDFGFLLMIMQLDHETCGRDDQTWDYVFDHALHDGDVRLSWY